MKKLVDLGAAVHTTKRLELNKPKDQIEAWLWEVWLTRWLKEEQEIGEVIVYFEQDPKDTPTSFWLKSLHNFANNKVKLNIRSKLKGATNESYKKGFEKTDPNAYRVFFDRHAGGLQDEEKTDFLGKDTYIWLDKGNSDFVKTFSPVFPQNNEKWIFPFELMEAGLLKVLIIDERIAEKSLAPVIDEKIRYRLTGYSRQPLTWHVACASKVYISTHLMINNEKFPLHAGSYKNIIDRAKQAITEQKISVPYLETQINTIEKRIEYDFARKIDENASIPSGEAKDLKIDFIIIHQGVLDYLNDNYKIKSEEVLDVLKNAASFVAVDSGRGIPPSLKGKKIKFLPYSILQDYVAGNRTGKLSLTQVAMALTRKNQNDEDINL